jgi:hypothetical protein
VRQLHLLQRQRQQLLRLLYRQALQELESVQPQLPLERQEQELLRREQKRVQAPLLQEQEWLERLGLLRLRQCRHSQVESSAGRFLAASASSLPSHLQSRCIQQGGLPSFGIFPGVFGDLLR